MDKLQNVYDLIDKVNDTREEVIKLENSVIVESNKEETVETVTYQAPILEEMEDIDELSEQISFYFDDIKNILSTGNIDKDSLRELLPSKDNFIYDLLIQRIILELRREINEINNFIVEEEVSVDELLEFKQDKEKLENLITSIREISLEKEEVDKSVQKNTIVFFEKEDGTPYVLDDLKGIPSEFKKPFLELFESIEDGTFKNVRYFTEVDNKISKVWEVRGFQVRVIFERVDKHKYIIITAFIKKSDRDLYYKTHLKTRLPRYFYKRDMIKKNVNDPEYLARCEDTLNKLYQSLGKEDLVERKTYHV